MSDPAEDKLAASAMDEASEVKENRAEEKIAVSAMGETLEFKAEVAHREEGIFAVPPTEEHFEYEDDVVLEATGGEVDGEAASVHIVHLIRPEGEEPEAFDIRTLASVVGSEAAAKEAVVYHYTLAASGFSARLTPKQVAHLSEKPEVLAVTPDKVCQLIR